MIRARASNPYPTKDVVEINFPDHPPLRRYRRVNGLFDCPCSKTYYCADEYHDHILYACSRYEKYRNFNAYSSKRLSYPQDCPRKPENIYTNKEPSSSNNRDIPSVSPLQLGNPRIEQPGPQHIDAKLPSCASRKLAAVVPRHEMDLDTGYHSDMDLGTDEYSDMDLDSESELDLVLSDSKSTNLPTRGPQNVSEERQPTPDLAFTETDSGTSTPDTSLSDWVVSPKPDLPADRVNCLSPSPPRARPPLFLLSPDVSPGAHKTVDAGDLESFRLDIEAGLLVDFAPVPCCPVRVFLRSLKRPLCYHLGQFYALGVKTAEDLDALAAMEHDWKSFQEQLADKGVTFMEWLYIKAGLEDRRRKPFSMTS